MTIWNKLRPYIYTIFVLGGMWKLASMSLSAAVLPAPDVVVPAFLKAMVTVEFWIHFGYSSARAGVAMSIAWVLGFPVGILMGASKRVDRALKPFVYLTYPIPKVVLLPIILLIFGLGEASKVIIIALILGYQVLVTTRDGVLGISREHFTAIRALGAGNRQIFMEVLIPAALPHGLTSLRLNSGVSVAVLFFVESFATTEGLGFLIMDAWGQMDFETMFTGIFGMSILGVILNESVNLMEKVLCPWFRVHR